MKPDGSDTLKTRATLLSRVRRGEEEGWNQFYDLYDNFIYSAGRAAGLSHEESRDLVQEAMITVQNYIGSFVADEKRARFRTWLRTIVQSRLADQFRKKRRNPIEHVEHHPASEDFTTATTNRIPDVNQVELDQIIDGKLEEAIVAEARKLTKQKVRMEDYQAYDLFELHDLSAADVAISLGISPVTVRVRTHRVRRAVAKEVRRIVKAFERPPFSPARKAAK